MAHGKDDRAVTDALRIGVRVRELREKHRYTLQDMAAKTGLSKEELSQIEDCETAPPVASLLKIAKALEVGMGYFFQEKSGSEEIALTRLSERVRIARRPHHHKGEVNYIYEALETKKSDKHMEPFLVEFPPMDTSEMVFVSHEGEEFLTLLEGKLEFRTQNRVEVLDPGDSIYFLSSISHSFRPIGDRSAKAIAVVWSKV
ncbi:MAG: XRE family transcriptional regulator [Deltaproteobacteria bacterium]|jgi:transcriptional regulator with XRE-family HTH domain|nr:XRE family transcriptional regulator [Deltaproteobacteria bacterium]